MKQTLAVTSLTLRTIPQRLLMSAAAVLSVALVVAVLLAFLAMSAGFAKTVGGSGADDVAFVIRSGSGAELNSSVTRDQYRLLEEGPGVARDASGAPIASAELYVIVDGIKRSSQTKANLPLRGVGERALEVRQGVEIVEGRMFAPGANEIVVGRAVGQEFQGFELNETVRLGVNEWRVVGVFSMNGSVFESELWADAGVLQNLYDRGSVVQSVRAKLVSPDALAAYKDYVENEPRLQLDVQSEREYYADQAGGLRTLAIFGWGLGVVMAVGAFAGAWNTMYAAVDGRAREIATLRAIGFSGWSAFVGAMVESVLLAALGGLLGALGAFFLFDGLSAATLGGSFTQVVFEFDIGPQAVVNGVILAVIVGLLGGFFPALRAARTPLLKVR